MAGAAHIRLVSSRHTLAGLDSSANGFLTLAFGENPVDDPQVTYQAIQLGWSPPDILRDSVMLSAGFSGWLAPAGKPDPESTFYGLLIGQAIGASNRDGSIAEKVREWMIGEGEPNLVDRADIRRVLFELALARELGIPWPSALRTAVHERLSDPSYDDEFQSDLLALRFIFGPNTTPPLPVDDTQVDPDLSLAGAMAKWLQERSSSGASTEAAEAVALGLRTSDGGCLFSQASPTPDLLSSALCKRILGRAIPPDAALLFADGRGYWYLPPTVTEGNSVVLRSLYLGLYLSGRIRNADGVVP